MKIFLALKNKLIKLVYKYFVGPPQLPVTNHNLSLIRMGSKYGGWVLVNDDGLKNSTILSCGLGEDASFDVEFCSKFNAKVIMVDPTPRAISHYNEMVGMIGSKPETEYTDNGCIPTSAYDLEFVNKADLVLCPFALWHKKETLKFFLPKNPLHVSHSIINFQNFYSRDTSYIEVDSITIDELMITQGIEKISLIKLDIEGAEVEVISDMLFKKIRPRQILVEYDELMTPSKISHQRIQSTHTKLLTNDYLLINRDKTNFTYINRLDFDI